jgi:carbamoyltransferase
MPRLSKKPQFGPRHPLLAAAGFNLALPFAELLFRQKHLHRPKSTLATARLHKIVATLTRGEAAYLAGIGIGGFHNSGIALVEVTRERGFRIICNNEEERFSGEKHSCKYPRASLEALAETMKGLGIGGERVLAWLTTFDFPLLAASRVRTVLEEFPVSLQLLAPHYNP